ncbi:MAG: hypothetical protein IJS94_06430 [Clostridia bacterium]|nr:hypothetical protein [Clostridia bacterium]
MFQIVITGINVRKENYKDFAYLVSDYAKNGAVKRSLSYGTALLFPTLESAKSAKAKLTEYGCEIPDEIVEVAG